MAVINAEVIKRYKQPTHKGFLYEDDTEADRQGHRRLVKKGANPLCGDTLTLELVVDSAPDPQIISARFEGYGCSLCLATADLLMEYAEGKPASEVKGLASRDLKELWGGLDVNSSREKCLCLAAQTVNEMLAN